jgi:23S rRNA (uracil1939-C5)-methyltransferase
MTDKLQQVTITKLVEGGQGLGQLPDGKKAFVWNALPGETVSVRIIKQKHTYAEAIAEEIITPSPDRVEPARAYFLSTSPWQIMTFYAENEYKAQLVRDIFSQAKIVLPKVKLTAIGSIEPGDNLEDQKGVYHYRNKMEYSFWGDDEGIHLALHLRGSHGKQIVTYSSIAMHGIDEAANAICQLLTNLKVRASDLKTVIVRESQANKVVASLFVKSDTFPKLVMPDELKGLRVYYSNPKSPASVRTKLLQEVGDVLLSDQLLGQTFTYDADSFFQINIPVYEQALDRIHQYMSEPAVVDMYAGVGSIGLSVATKSVELVELDPATAKMAAVNAAASPLNANVIETSTEKALDYITRDKPVIFDPPRAGLHHKVITRVLDVQPPKITYLSCNPSTQARDIALLKDKYDIMYIEAFNFFPRTPHIETLVILQRR